MKRVPGATIAVALCVAGFALALAYAGASRPQLFLAAPVFAGAILVVIAAARWPSETMSACVFAILIASTKFRLRDPTLSLSGAIDSQIMLELGLFACVGLALFVVTRGPAFVWRALSTSEMALCAYTIVAFASVAWSGDRDLTLIRAWQLATTLAFAIVLLRVFAPRQALRAVAWPLLTYAVGFAVLAKLFPFAKGTQVDFLGIHRFSWFAVHPIDAATFVALGILFVAVELLFAEAPLRLRLFRVPLWLYLIPLSTVLIVTHSRGPLLACVAAVGIVAVRRMVGVLAGSLGVAALLMIAVVMFNGGETVGRMLTGVQASQNPAARLLFRGQTTEEIASFTDRDQVWSLAEELIANRPVAGYGYQGSRSYLLAVVPWAAYAHNALLQTLLDLGIIGTLLLWLPFVRTAFVGSINDPRLDPDTLATRGVALTIVLFLLVSSFSSESFAAAPGYQTALLFTCILAAEQVRGRAVAARPMRVGVAWWPALTGATR